MIIGFLFHVLGEAYKSTGELKCMSTHGRLHNAIGHLFLKKEKMKMDSKRYYTKKELERLFNRSREWIRIKVNDGTLPQPIPNVHPYYQVWDKAEVDSFIEKEIPKLYGERGVKMFSDSPRQATCNICGKVLKANNCKISAHSASDLMLTANALLIDETSGNQIIHGNSSPNTKGLVKLPNIETKFPVYLSHAHCRSNKTKIERNLLDTFETLKELSVSVHEIIDEQLGDE